MPAYAQPTHYRMKLDNHSNKFRLGAVRYAVEQEGPENAVKWTATVFIGHDERGKGQGGTKKTAKEAAALEALLALDVVDSGTAAT